ncbi:unnamed protein product [Scytosiphon promiscuus]
MGLFEALFVGFVLVAMLSLLFVGWKTPEVVVFLALVLVWNAGTVSTEDALSGFNNPGVLAVGSLFVVIKGVERSRLADRAARHVFGLRTSLSAGLLRLMGLAFVLSAFLNNTPVVALLIPITRDWALTRGFSPAVLLMPLSFACIFGGLITIIGTSTNLVVQGLVLDEAKNDPTIEGIGFLEPGYIGFPLGMVGMLYLVVAAPRVLAGAGGGDGGGGSGADRTGAGQLLTEVQVSHDFLLIGKSVALVLARLGLPAEALVKLRRTPQAMATAPPAVPRQERVRSHTGLSGGEETTASLTGSGSEAFTAAAAAVAAGATGLTAQAGGCAATSSPRVRRRLSVTGDGGAHSVFSAGGAVPSSSSSLSTTTLSPPSQHPNPNRSSPSPRLAAGHGAFLSPQDHGGVGGESGARTCDTSHLNETLCPVSSLEMVRDGDILVLACPQPTMLSFLGSVLSEGSRGLGVLGASAAQLRSHAAASSATDSAAVFLELVLSDSNHFVGRRPSGHDAAMLASRYGCRILAVRPCSTAAASVGISRSSGDEEGEGEQKGSLVFASRSAHGCGVSSPLCPGDKSVDSPVRGGKRKQTVGLNAVTGDDGVGRMSLAAITTPATPAEGSVEAAERPLAPGDVVLVVAGAGFLDLWKDAPEFDLVTRVGAVPKAVVTYDYLSLLVFCGMLGWVLFSSVTMVRAAFVAGGVLIVGGWVNPKRSVGYVDWALLLLVGSALGLSKAISNSGLAGYAGNAIKESGMSASASLYLLYGFTMVCTELITNNAAAALAVPVALSIAKELEVSYKPFVLTVMMAASSSFITPIGYQTNTMVWAPGGYKFSDFIRLGTPLSLIYMVVGSFLMPCLFPF